MRDEMVSLWCSVSSLLVFTWIEVKWNSKRYEFHIGHFEQNEFQISMRFSCEHNLPETKWISADSLVVAFSAHAHWNSMLVRISYRSFWQKWNFISGDRISCKHHPKCTAYTCASKYWVIKISYLGFERSCRS